ncbi:trigger factor [Ruoffia tabacinasalis]|jgi:trigger factor|uniref:Trigger factor n=1 Tax=Ruoffia tabacinasalis TaxID=87458 RepID=A0A5R9EJQ9_9LACT|nr:trigger factor [Ruoffia tabacinasalis]MBG9977343.1 trigger factor [Ruoffia tabacinasalis]TLQ49202.1 trigger factor [Ruoffia tabacinasalis]HJG47317.1 trigger factor [Ruoffia tabacinasalis]
MTTNFEKATGNEGTLTFEIPQEEVKKGLDQAFKKVQKTVSVPGFRKGKVPRQIFNNVYGEEALYDEALNAVLPDAYEAAVKEAGLDVVGQPKLDIETIGKKEPWVMKAEVTLKPDVELGDYKGLSVEKQDTEVTEEDVQNAIKSRQEKLAELVVKDSEAVDGDTVVIDYEGFVDTEAFDGGKAENHSLELGSNSFIPGFEEQLVGTKAGDNVDVNVTFPEEYQAEELAGKEAVFKVTVHEVKATELPELDDEFAKDVDDEVETLAELENKIRVQLEEEKQQAAKEVFEDLALRQAVDNAEVEGGVPWAMVHEEIHRQMDYFLNNLSRQGIQPEMYYQITGTTSQDLHDQFEEEAELRTKTNLVLEAIVKAENLEVSDEEKEEEVKSLAEQYGMEVDQVRGFVSDDMLDSDIKMKKAMSIIVDSAEEK